MSLRLLPNRTVAEHDIVNMFALADANVNDYTNVSGDGDEGVFVKVSVGNLDLDPVVYSTDAYLGSTAGIPHLGSAGYPKVSLKVVPAVAGVAPAGLEVLGITLKQTAKMNQHGEKLLYNQQFMHEANAVLPGQTVPIATKGYFTVSALAIAGTALTAGAGFKLSATAGKIQGCTLDDADCLGMVLGTGTRTALTGSDAFAGAYAYIAFRI